MKSLFVMDPLHKINVAGDSTYMAMRECSDRDWPVAMCTPSDLFARNGRTSAKVTPVRTTEDAPYFHTEDDVVSELGAFDVVWMRKDPPFDMSYILATYLLEMVPGHTLVVNDPIGLKRFNEKLWVQQQWPQFQPDTLLSRNIEQLRAFINEQPGKSVIKPWDGNGGRGVLITDGSDRNLSSMLELLTQEGTEMVIGQAYLPGVVKGDTRVLIFDGEVVGAMDRVPNDTDHRANMHAGASVKPAELSAVDQEICAAIAPHLVAHGQVFVGIDLIDGHLTEINVTSPTGIRELNRLYGLRLEATLVDKVHARWRKRHETGLSSQTETP